MIAGACDARLWCRRLWAPSRLAWKAAAHCSSITCCSSWVPASRPPRLPAHHGIPSRLHALATHSRHCNIASSSTTTTPVGWPTPDDSPTRLDALLTRCGYCSRAEARQWVDAGRVRVSGARARRAADKAAPSSVTVDGEALEHPYGLVLLLHKPPGVVCSSDSSEGPRVMDLLPERWQRRTPGLSTVGRLDKDTSGALLITDSGPLVHALTAPSKTVTKVYEVAVNADWPAHAVEAFADGRIVLDGSPCAPAVLMPSGPRSGTITLTEGRYHQVKRMCAAVGCPVTELHRVAFGAWTVDDTLPRGQWRVLPLA